MPSLVTLDTLAARTVFVSLPALAAGVGLGLVRLTEAGGGFDALMVASLATIGVYTAYVLLRLEAGWQGRRAAYLALVGFALVIVVRLALPLAHFA
jgi:ABC-type transport system involved in cytochrome c biogenesis permease subunit